ncbi:hypothetical protein ACVWXM_001446 [Bradyrhizobium sp. GM7.3]
MPAMIQSWGRRKSRVGATIKARPRQRHQNAIERSLVEPNGNGAPAATKDRSKLAGRLQDQRMLGSRRRIVVNGGQS